jgi:5,6-dimethylbenzimidazole synthase
MSKHAFPSQWRRGVYEAIERRRDMRSFLPDPIPHATLARLLAAAHRAGSVGFSQPWNFLVVDDPEIRIQIQSHVEAERVRAAEAFPIERRAQYLAHKLEAILEAPINLCVTCDPQRFGPAIIGRHTIAEAAMYSTCGAIQNFWLAARAEGIGVGWVSIFAPDALRSALMIPEHIVPVAYLCVGWVEEFPDRPTLESSGWLPRLELSSVVFANRWNQQPDAEFAQELAATRPSGDEAGAAAAMPDTAAAGAGPTDRKGLLLVYTGHGKGKTTAALGLVFRALGRGMQVAVIQFIKGKWKTGERLFAETLPGLTFLVMGKGFTWESDDLSRDRAAAVAAWTRVRELLAAGLHDLIILDEITYAIHYGFLDLGEVVSTVRDRPVHVHVVITGRNAPQELCALADLVTEMKSVKHPFTTGTKAQLGIDY